MENKCDERSVQQFAGLVVSIIKKLNIPYGQYDDCYQSGMIGMIKGLDNFDPDKGKLTTHIYNNIRWEILKHLKRERRYNPVPLYDRAYIEESIDISEYIPKLTPLEQNIIDLRLQSYSLKQISDKLDLKGSYFIYRKYQAILRKIRDYNQINA